VAPRDTHICSVHHHIEPTQHNKNTLVSNATLQCVKDAVCNCACRTLQLYHKQELTNQRIQHSHDKGA